jgi:hypothetical protein
MASVVFLIALASSESLTVRPPPPTAYLACLGLRTIETLDECLQFDPDANETPGKKVFVSE